MNAVATIETFDQFDANVTDAELPTETDMSDFAALCDMDGHGLEIGNWVQVSGMSGWYEIDTIKPGSRRVEVIAPNGEIYDVLASEVAIAGI